jgi:hypothetical protein
LVTCSKKENDIKSQKYFKQHSCVGKMKSKNLICLPDTYMSFRLKQKNCGRGQKVYIRRQYWTKCGVVDHYPCCASAMSSE